MYKYEELNDAKDSRPFPFPTNSIHKLHNELTDAAGCLANDRFTQGKKLQRKWSDKGYAPWGATD